MRSIRTNRNQYRRLVVGAETKITLDSGRVVKAINLDNAASTPPFLSVMEKIIDFAPWYSSIHRGTGYKSELSSTAYEKARETVAEFVHTDLKDKDIIFVNNTTEAINKLSNCFTFGAEDIVLITQMEHHSNDLPWRKFKHDYIKVKEDGRLCLDSLQEKLEYYQGKVKLVTVTGASNVTGYKNPIHYIASLAHQHGARIVVDGAQLIPHASFDMKPVYSPEHIDYLVFSAHKMYAPFGIGVLIGWKDTLNSCEPDYPGGGTVKIVTGNEVLYDSSPYKHEAGSPNVIGTIALIEAMSTLKNWGMEEIEAYEYSLASFLYSELQKIKGVQLYTTFKSYHENLAIIPFNIEGIRHDIVAKDLADLSGIAVRSGCFCAHPYIQTILQIPDEEIQEHLKNPPDKYPYGMVRVSIGLYNTKHEIEILLNTIKEIVQKRCLFDS